MSGKQKTRRKKAAVALARKISVIAWALLRDEKDWEPKRMIEVTESFGRIPTSLKDTLLAMKPKENSDQRKSRLRREAREARAVSADQGPIEQKKKTVGAKSAKTSMPKTGSKATATKQKTPSTQSTRKTETKTNPKSTSTSTPKKRSVTSSASSIAEEATTKSRRARKPVSRSAEHAQAAY